MENFVLDLYNKFREIYFDVKSKALESFQTGDLEGSLEYIVGASTFAWYYHLGIWFDDELENLLQNIATKIFSSINDLLKNFPKSKKNKTHRVLFITTFLTDIGGHTEALKIWIECLSKEYNELYVISTQTFSRTIMYETANFIKRYVDLYFLSWKESYIQRIIKLIEIISKIQPDYVVLFSDPNDVIAVSVLSVLKDFLKFKIIFFNHADHVFWLGKNIIDLLVEFRSYSVYISQKFRKFKGDITVIPLTTDIYKRKTQYSGNLLKNSDKKNTTISLSIGAAWKLTSEGYWDYFEVIKRILEQNPDHIHVLIAHPEKFVKNKLNSLPEEIKSRIKFIPGIPDPLPYYKCADFLIETFPVIGGTVRVEAMALGLPIVFIRNKYSGLLSVTDALPQNYPFIAESNEEVVNYSNQLIKNKRLRENLSKFLKNFFFEKFSYEIICNQIRKIFLKGNSCKAIENLDRIKGLNEDEKYLLLIDYSYRNFKDPYSIIQYLRSLKSAKD